MELKGVSATLTSRFVTPSPKSGYYLGNAERLSRPPPPAAYLGTCGRLLVGVT